MIRGSEYGVSYEGLGAIGDDNRLGRDIEASGLGEIYGDRFPEIGDTRGSSVSGLPFFEGLDSRLFDVFRRIKIGLADAEVDDLSALGD